MEFFFARNIYSAIGGFVTGFTFGKVNTKSMVVLEAGANEFTSTFTGMSLETATGRENYSKDEIWKKSLFAGGIGMTAANLEFNFSPVNKGRNSYSAIYKSTYTKFSNNTINNISINTFGKSVSAQILPKALGIIMNEYTKSFSNELLICR